MGNTAIELTQAPRDLAAAVDEATRSGEVVVTRSGEAVAKVIPLAAATAARQPGSDRGQIHMAEEFDATPEEFVGTCSRAAAARHSRRRESGCEFDTCVTPITCELSTHGSE